MEDPTSIPPKPGTPPAASPETIPGKSFGNIGDHHWSRARRDSNAEAIDYYRERSHAPGVAEGGGPRNMYCMRCDGVIPLGTPVEVCPHCGTALEGDVKRYFNWVEIDRAPKSDVRALWPMLAIGFVAVVGIAWLIFRWVTTVWCKDA